MDFEKVCPPPRRQRDASDNHDDIALSGNPFRFQPFVHQPNEFVGAVHEGQAMGHDAPQQTQSPLNPLVGRESDDGSGRAALADEQRR
jgi:hypothetical protein